nr:hypothetical protein [Tanacetum cinerariifolium]
MALIPKIDYNQQIRMLYADDLIVTELMYLGLRIKSCIRLKNDRPPRDKMDDRNITVEEYIRLEEEKAQKCGKAFNWETAKYGKIWYDEDVHDLRSVETEFPAIVFNDNLTSDETLSCEPTVSSLNDNKTYFRISFDKFDNEDYTEEVVHQRLRKTLTHVLELSSCVYLDDRAWGVLNFDSAGVRL